MKVLIVRFSSFGDIVQSLASAEAIKKSHPKSVIHWVVRSDFTEVVQACPFVDKVWSFERKEGLKGLLSLSKTLSQENFSHIYDAHNNLRSRILTKFLKSEHFIRRSKERWNRFLEFQLHIRRFHQPYLAQKSYVAPLVPWHVEWSVPLPPLFNVSDFKKYNLSMPYVTLVPSAAWPKKRWPIEHWITLLGDLRSVHVVLLGGPEDTFINELAATTPGPVTNLAGKLSWLESIQVVAGSRAVVSADTGLLHVADALKTPTVALIGPSAFGYPSQPTSRVLETQLYCKPCSKDGRGRCRNKVYQKCMKDITPLQVTQTLRRMGAVVL